MGDAALLRVEKEVSEMASGRRQYTRTKPLPTRLSLNEFQRDVVLGAIKREMTAVGQNKDTPPSLRILALAQLREVLLQLEPEDDDGEPV